ncbi:unnamed protein product, partial [Lampetra planeri]
MLLLPRLGTAVAPHDHTVALQHQPAAPRPRCAARVDSPRCGAVTARVASPAPWREAQGPRGVAMLLRSVVET